MTEPQNASFSGRIRAYALVAAAIALGAAAVWIALRGGDSPQAGRKVAAAVLLWLDALPAVGAWWVAAAGYGLCLQKVLLRSVKSFSIALALGATALLGAAWGMLWLVGTATWSAWALLAPGIASAAWHAWRASRQPAHVDTPGITATPETSAAPRTPWTVLLALPGAGLLLSACALPPGTLWRVEAFGYDVLSYHLQIPHEWIAAGGMVQLQHSVYSYLPGLTEAGFTMIALLRGAGGRGGADGGGVLGSVYACQLWHAGFAVLAAVLVASTARRWMPPRAAWIPGALLLATPWVVITGSMAYDEMVMLALFAAALRIVLDVHATRPGHAVAVGLLVGGATLAKLTAGFMVAVPVGLVLLLRLHGGGDHGDGNARDGNRVSPGKTAWKRAVRSAVIAGGVGAAVLSPYLLRNALWTGNPVFPFATELLGYGHWDATLAARWNAGHGLAGSHGLDFTALPRQWWFNTGYGALGGTATPTESQNIARFDREYGFPVLWIAAAFGLAAACFGSRRPRPQQPPQPSALQSPLPPPPQPQRRRIAGALVFIVVVQLIAWHAVTHLQSRFLIPTLVPGVLLASFAFAWLLQHRRRAVAFAGSAGAVLLVFALFTLSLRTFWTQTQRLPDPQTGQRLPAPPWEFVDSLTPPDARAGILPGVDHHPIDDLPPGAKVMLIADTSGLLYLDRPIVYASAFDASPLGDILDDTQDDPAQTAQRLHDLGVTHLWLGWSELARLHATYGHDARVTEPVLRRLTAGWPVVFDGGSSTLVSVP